MLTETDYKRIDDLLERGLSLQAYEAAKPYGNLSAWKTVKDQLLAARVADAAGGDRLGSSIRLRAWRAAPQDESARTWYGWELLARRGEYAAWEFLRDNSDFVPADPDDRATWLALDAQVARQYRDFDLAEQRLKEVEALGTNDRWAMVERVYLLFAEDRRDEALAAARRVPESIPDYATGYGALAFMLGTIDRHEEAIEVLLEAAPKFEVGAMWFNIARRQMEMRRYDEAWQSVDRYESMSPLADKAVARWLAGIRSDLAYLRGDREGAIRFAEKSDAPFFKTLVDNLRAAGSDGRRVLLNVPLVRQHHMTCAPATLSAVARFWNREVDHLEVVDAICYDGTSDYDERTWMEKNGFRAREFTVTWDAARALLDRGAPFTLATAVPGRGHLQAVVGYDEARRTLLVRDPSSSYLCEYLAEGFLGDYRSTGPRGAALVPAERADLLDGVELPDAELYDLRYQAAMALQRHDRATAERCVAEMQSKAAGERLALYGAWSLAAYDGRTAAIVEAIEGLLKLYPDDALLLSRRLQHLDAQTHRGEREAILKPLCETKDAQPYFLVEYAWFLSEDDRQQAEAMAVLRRSARRQSIDEGLLSALARIARLQRRLDRSMQLYRLATALSDKREGYAQSYFQAARHLKRTDEALAFLESRFRRHAAKSGQPGQTLFWALEAVDRETEGFKVLDEAIALRADDGDLLLYAANAHARHGQYERAEQLLAEARSRTSPVEWLRQAAHLAGRRNQREQAIDYWRQVLRRDPSDAGAHREIAELLGETEGLPAAIEHLRAAIRVNPHSYDVRQILIEYLRQEHPDEYLAATRELVELAPIDAWAQREHSAALRTAQRFDEAIAAADLACRLDAASAYSHGALGLALLGAGRLDEARESLREAIRRSVDADYPITRLLQTYTAPKDRREVLAFVRQQLVEQVIFGDGLLTYRDHALEILDGEEVLGNLREALDARPDLWHAWSAVTMQLLDMGRLEEAEKSARRETERFPLVPRTWYDLALVCSARKDTEGERGALERALAIAPKWSRPGRSLSEIYEREGNLAEARRVLERVVENEPLESVNHGYLAHMLWKLGEGEKAIEHAARAVGLSWGYDWAWDRLREWSAELGEKDRAVAAARELVRKRPASSGAWLVLARMLRGPETLDERLEALDRAISLNPRREDLYDLKASLLADAGRVDEALAACRPAVWGDQPPSVLRMRAARIAARHDTVSAGEAIDELKKLLLDDPQNYDAWRDLADICDEAERPADQLKAAEQLVRLRPTLAESLSYMGQALEKNGNRDQAKSWYRRVIEKSPDYAFPALSLFDLHLEDNEITQATEVMGVLRTHQPGPYVWAREVQLAAARGDWPAARERLAVLASRPDDSDWVLDAPAKTLADGHQTDLLATVLVAAETGSTIHPNVGRVWMRHIGANLSFAATGEYVARLLPRGEAGIRAAVDHLTRLGEREARAATRAFVKKHREVLRSDVRTWGSAAYALDSIGDYKATVDWLADYRSREGAQAWMLCNLTDALRELGRDREAWEVGRYAMGLPDSEATNSHRAAVAYFAALAGELGEAERAIGPVKEKSLDTYHQAIYHAAQALLAVGRGGIGAETCRKAHDHLGSWRFKGPKNDTFLARARKMAIRRIARQIGGLRGLVWLARVYMF